MRGLRLALSTTLLLGGLFNPVAAEAPPAAGIARIGYLALARNLTGQSPLQQAFLQGLRDHGYVEGRDVVIEYRDAKGDSDRLPAIASELVALKVGVIVATDTPAALAAKQAARTLPIVFAQAADPVASGLITNLARPVGNLTGLSNVSPELHTKRLELLKQAVPGGRSGRRPLAFGCRPRADVRAAQLAHPASQRPPRCVTTLLRCPGRSRYKDPTPGVGAPPPYGRI